MASSFCVCMAGSLCVARRFRVPLLPVPVTGKPSLHMGGQQGEAGMRHRQAWSSGAAALSQGHGHLVPTLLPARAVCAVGGGQAQQYGGGWGKRPTQVSFPPPPVLSQ